MVPNVLSPCLFLQHVPDCLRRVIHYGVDCDIGDCIASALIYCVTNTTLLQLLNVLQNAVYDFDICDSNKTVFVPLTLNVALKQYCGRFRVLPLIIRMCFMYGLNTSIQLFGS